MIMAKELLIASCFKLKFKSQKSKVKIKMIDCKVQNAKGIYIF